ncbi:hypothetical protein [Haloferax denitrificans]|uniref:Uncharacterized protein n=1 Tax=Haloferax denitrificans ATCC 35960 TaxID=662478 RepID=M0J465_9EURY|nr:hypothetical protein [Haloferax denitrificans]EMA03123.1 hypothetical protein C438_13891 [Haloferax denitrificans ATCC 35960]
MNRDSVARLTRLVTALGAVLVLLGLAVQVTTLRLGLPHPPWELRAASDAEVLGVGLWWVAVATRLVGPRRARRRGGAEREAVYVTRGLLDALLDRAARAEPSRESLSLGTAAAGELDGAESLDETRRVFSHFVHPSAGAAVRGVFGVDLATAPGRTPGQFVSHPWGPLAATKRDTLREVVLVAVPPWDDDCVAAFDRAGRRRPLRVVDAEPRESFDEPVPTAGSAASPSAPTPADG